MRALVIICLIAALNCNFIDTVICIASNPKVSGFLVKVFELIKEKNLNELPSLLIANFSNLYQAVTECLNTEDDVILKSKPEELIPPTKCVF